MKAGTRKTWAACVLPCSALLLIAAIDAPGAPSATPRAAVKVYSDTCGYCHGANVGPVIRGRALPADAIRMIVRHGQNGMPAFRPSEISPAELDSLADWIESSRADPKEKGQ